MGSWLLCSCACAIQCRAVPRGQYRGKALLLLWSRPSVSVKGMQSEHAVFDAHEAVKRKPLTSKATTIGALLRSLLLVLLADDQTPLCCSIRRFQLKSLHKIISKHDYFLY